MDLLKKMESVQQRADEVDLKAERRNRELAQQLQNIESTIGVIQDLNSRLVGTLAKFTDRFHHIVQSIEKIETHLEEKLDAINGSLEQGGKATFALTERVSGFEERQHNVETKVLQLEKMFTDGTLQSNLVQREELTAALDELRERVRGAARADELTGMTEQVAGIAAQLQTVTKDRLRPEEMGDTLDELRGQLQQCRDEIREGLESTAPSGDLTDLDRQVEELAVLLRTMTEEAISRPELDATIRGLRVELDRARADLRAGIEEATTSAAQPGLEGVNEQVERMAERLGALAEDAARRRQEGTARREQQDQALAGLRDKLQSLEQTLSGVDSREAVAGVAATVEGLTARLDSLEQAGAEAEASTADDEQRAELDGLRKDLTSLRTVVDGLSGAASADDLSGLRDDLSSLRAVMDSLAGAASAEDLDALREELAHAVTDIEAVRSTADAGASADTVGRGELDAAAENLRGELETSAEKLRSELEQARTELRGSLAAADDVFALREQLASHATEMEAASADAVKADELRAAVDKVRKELDDARYKLQGSLSGAATAEDVAALEERLLKAAEPAEGTLSREEMESALTDLRFEFNSITDDLRHAVAGAASANDLDAIKQRLAGNTAEFKAVASAVMPEEMEAALSKLRDEQESLLAGMRTKLDGAATADDLASVRDKLASSSESGEPVGKAATRDDLNVTAAMLREDLNLSQAEMESDIKSVKAQLELALNDIEFIKSAQEAGGSSSVEDLRIEMATVRAALQESSPDEEKAKDVEGLHKQFVGLAMDVSSTESEMKKRMDEIQRKHRLLEQDMRKKLAAGDGAVVPVGEAGLSSIKREVEKITTGYARKSEVNTSIKETNAAFRKIVQDFDTKQVELRGMLDAEAEARMQKQNEKTEEAMSRFQHMINEFQQQLDAGAAMQKEFKDLKQQMILTQNAIMELNQFVEDQLKDK